MRSALNTVSAGQRRRLYFSPAFITAHHSRGVTLTQVYTASHYQATLHSGRMTSAAIYRHRTPCGVQTTHCERRMCPVQQRRRSRYARSSGSITSWKHRGVRTNRSAERTMSEWSSQSGLQFQLLLLLHLLLRLIIGLTFAMPLKFPISEKSNTISRLR